MSQPLSPDPEVRASTEAHLTKAATALTPPTSEELNDTKKEQDESDLSELDLEDEDEEEILPDHYWDGENGGKIPVFKPTMDQFRSFKKFMEKVDRYGMKSGIIKVIPPQEWRDSLPALDEHVKRIKIKNPITQEFNGTFGTYTQQNVEKQRSYNLPEWKALTEETQHQHPAKRGERRRNQAQVVRGGGGLRGRATPKGLKEEGDEGTPKPRKPGRTRQANLPADEGSNEECGKAQDSSTRKPKKRSGKSSGAGQAKSVSSRRLNNTSEAVDKIDEKAFKGFDYRLDGLDEYTAERCAELETLYWKSLGFNQPMYAADMPGSLFEDKTTSWNVAHLENLLDVLGTKVPGVNTAYLYMGMWKATFAWHLEDVDLYSINYIHFGAPKQWYSISQEDARKFERAMKQIWPVDSKNCDQFLRHKTYLISPDVLLKQHGVKVNKLVHYEGEFVITFPYGYHSGYNIGYNCAESVNFATESWLEFGRIARKCNCEADNVWVDVGEIERKLRGEPTPEYYEETDDEDDIEEEDGSMPTPPASIKGQKASSKKRKRETKQEITKKKKRKIRIKIRTPTREPCVMCPNDNPWEALLPTDSGKKAHRSCATFTPETYIINDHGQEKVCGVGNIDKARLDLKCNFCRSKRGACFQCSSKKCTRAFHATCAIAAGVLIDSGLVPTFGEDGTEYFEEGFDLRCRYHRPKMPKIVDVDGLENSKLITSYAKNLKPNDTVQAQYINGEVFGGLVIENRASEHSVIVDVLPDGDRVEVEYKWLCVLNPDDSVRPKPSAAALPMPENISKSNFSIANRQDGVPTQDDTFHTDTEFKWHDFYNYHTPPPGYQTVQFRAPLQLKVKDDSVFYYIPEVSTDAKVFFAEKPGSKDVCARAIFLERANPKAVQQHQVIKQAIAPANVNTFTRIQPAPNTSFGMRNDKPYIYKPKEPARPNARSTVDYKALNDQRDFLAQGDRRPSYSQLPLAQQSAVVNHAPAVDEQTGSATPLRSFAPEHYYSSRTLPAAYQGEYSKFRRESQGAQTMQRPNCEPVGYVPNYQSVSSQKTALKHGNASVVMSASNPWNGQPSFIPEQGLLSGPCPSSAESRPSSGYQNQLSPNHAPLTPATTLSSVSKSEVTQSENAYLQNLQQYPYLLNSFCRRAKEYESPYTNEGGFTAKYQPLELQKHIEPPAEMTSAHTPRHSMSSSGEPSNQQWTPPSQAWDRAAFTHTRNTPPSAILQHPEMYQKLRSGNYPSAMHQASDDLQRQIQNLPSTASRDGAQARMLRDHQSPPHGQYILHQRNNIDQAPDAARIRSPQAVTLSPASDPKVTGYSTTKPSQWDTMPTSDCVQGSPPLQAGNGPCLHQIGGQETWRYD